MKRITVLLAAMLLALSLMSPAWSGGSSDRQSSDVFWLSDGTQVEGADARLTRTDSGVSYDLRTTGLMKGHAVSIWWVIFNNPEHCQHGEEALGLACGALDLFELDQNGEIMVDEDGMPVVNEDVDPAVMSGGGNVVGESGRSSFADHLNEGEITNEHPAFEDGPGLTDPRGAEIHIVVRSHGPKVEAHMPEQLKTFGAGCKMEVTPEMPEEEGECADLQFAAFK